MAYLDEILQQALALPPADRAFVVAALEESLSAREAPPPTGVTEAGGPDTVSAGELLGELRRRSAAYRNGTMAARPAADVIADLRRPSVRNEGQ